MILLRIQCCYWLMWHRHSWHSTAISCKALPLLYYTLGWKSETFLQQHTRKGRPLKATLNYKSNLDWLRHYFTLSYLDICKIYFYTFYLSFTYPGIPPDSILLAKVTSSLQTSNCHLRKPMTPQRTLPVWTPIRMSTLVCVISRTALKTRKFRMNAGLAIAHSSALLRVSGL